MTVPCSSAAPVQQKTALVVASGTDIDELLRSVLASDGWSIHHAVDNQHALALATTDPFDLIAHVAYGQKPLTRRERADNVKKRNYFAKYGDKARAVLEALLEKYADEGLTNLEDPKVLKVQPFNKYGTPLEIIKAFGGRDKYFEAVRELEKNLYEAA